MAIGSRNKAAGLETGAVAETVTETVPETVPETVVTIVVHVKRSLYDIYIGRSGDYRQHVSRCPLCQRRPLNLCSVGAKLIGLGNPYELGKDGDRRTVIGLFDEYARRRMAVDPWYRRMIKSMYGRVLGCWCKRIGMGQPGELCHGDVYVKLTEELNRDMNRNQN